MEFQEDIKVGSDAGQKNLFPDWEKSEAEKQDPDFARNLSSKIWSEAGSKTIAQTENNDKQVLFPEPESGSAAASERLKKVQEASRDALESSLSGSSMEKRLVLGMQNAIISGDTGSFRQNLNDIYQALSYQAKGRQEVNDMVRNDLRVVERVLRQKCGVDINIDLTADDRVIVRMRPDTIALELSKDSVKVRRVEDAGGTVVLDNSKEVIRPSPSELAKIYSERCLNSRQW